MRGRIAALGLALCLSSGLGGAPVAAVAAVAAVDADNVDDVDAYADYHGIDRAAAERELEDVPRVAALQEWLATKDDASFGGLWITHDPAYRVEVALVDEAPGRAARLAADFGIEGPVRQLDVRRSYGALVATADNLRGRRQAKDHVVRIDVRRNRVLVDALDPASYTARADGRAAKAAGAAIERAPRLGGPSIYAGLHTSTCTLGWTVRKNGTTTDGITTAAHCPDSQSYAGTNLPIMAASNGSADTQWHTTPGFIDEARFRWNSAGNTRVPTSRKLYSNVVIGETVCKYGMTTGYGCGEVEEKEADAHWVPNQTGRYISLKRCDTDLSTEGDSGGPVFFNYAAYGIVSGWQFGGLLCKDELVFASVSYMQSNLNLTIKLG